MSRDEARRLILDIARYIERTEPSHPAPPLLRRAEKLLGAKSFFEIVRNMTPDGMHQLEMIAGRPEVSDDNSSN
jgi:type VI secretion system protein ImpA